MMLSSVIPQLLPTEPISATHLLLGILLLMFFTWLLPSIIRSYISAKILNRIPGPPTHPIFGNSPVKRLTPQQQFRRMIGFSKLYGQDGLFRIWFGHHKFVFLTNHKAVEPLVTSNTELHKGNNYDLIRPWLGNGLITVNDGRKWFSHRKLLTPAFHFKILEDFLIVMNKQAKILIGKLQEKADGKPFNIHPYINLCALDIISESAMGVSINAQNQEESVYLDSIARITGIPVRAVLKPWLRVSYIYALSKEKRADQEDVKILKSFTNNVIKERRALMEANKGQNQSEDILPEGSKKRMAFLDLILSSNQENGKVQLTDQEIQEEVDTFMFAGHDTTTQAINWFMCLMGIHPEIQEKVYEEQMEVLGDKEAEPTATDLRNMKYLERCTKEALRILPSVPFIARNLQKDTVINGHLVPAGTNVSIFIYALHQDPTVFKDPEIFNPDRFLNEKMAGVNPYAYIPFSAGPRNCIGQKFAQWEEKAVISHLIRNFKVTTDMKFDTMEFQQQVILYPTNGIIVKLEPRL